MQPYKYSDAVDTWLACPARNIFCQNDGHRLTNFLARFLARGLTTFSIMDTVCSFTETVKYNPPRRSASGRVYHELSNKSSKLIKSTNPPLNPRGEGFMPPPYPPPRLRLAVLLADVPGYLAPRPLQNQSKNPSYFWIDFWSLLGAILEPFWLPFCSVFGLRSLLEHSSLSKT